MGLISANPSHFSNSNIRGRSRTVGKVPARGFMPIADVYSTVHTVYCAHCISYVHKLEKQGIRALLNPCVRRIGTTQNYVKAPHTLSLFQKVFNFKRYSEFLGGKWSLEIELPTTAIRHTTRSKNSLSLLQAPAQWFKSYVRGQKIFIHETSCRLKKKTACTNAFSSILEKKTNICSFLN